jgi:hypothetical protein
MTREKDCVQYGFFLIIFNPGWLNLQIPNWKYRGLIVFSYSFVIHRVRVTAQAKILSLSQVLVTHTCHPSFLEGWDQEDHGLRPAWANSLRDPHLQNIQSKMGWRCGSSSRVAALQVRSPEFKSPPKKQKKIKHAQNVDHSWPFAVEKWKCEDAYSEWWCTLSNVMAILLLLWAQVVQEPA